MLSRGLTVFTFFLAGQVATTKQADGTLIYILYSDLRPRSSQESIFEIADGQSQTYFCQDKGQPSILLKPQSELFRST